MDRIIKLRHELHQNPELSGNEKGTSLRIVNFLSKYQPNEIHSGVGGNGIAAVYNGKENGPTLLFRCDMDALPIQEISDRPYKSLINGVAHLCGHDGHMALVSGLAMKLHENPIRKGRVVLFYQPEEENGKGAAKSISELIKLNLKPDFAFAIHNIPKHPTGSVILGRYTFSAASKGVTIKLTGKNAHAAYPESGISPALAIAEIIQSFSRVKELVSFKDFILLTIVHTKLGEPAFGTSPGEGVVLSTLRAFDNDDMDKLTHFVEDKSKEIAKRFNLSIDISYSEEFPATVCDNKLTRLVEHCAIDLGLDVISLEQPNRWSEDFAHFTAQFPSVIFGIGAGTNHPDLHTNSYDFPDEIIPIGVELMERICRNLLG